MGGAGVTDRWSDETLCLQMNGVLRPSVGVNGGPYANGAEHRNPDASPQKEVFSAGTGFGVDVEGEGVTAASFPSPLMLLSYDLARRLTCRGAC